MIDNDVLTAKRGAFLRYVRDRKIRGVFGSDWRNELKWALDNEYVTKYAFSVAITPKGVEKIQ